MGSVLLWVARGLMVGGGAAIGIMFEKLSSWVSGVLPSSVKTTDSSGRPAVWYIFAIVSMAGAAVYFVAKMIAGKKKIFSWVILLMSFGYVADATLNDSAFRKQTQVIGLGDDFVAASLLLSIAASSTEAKSINFLSEFITFNATTVPTSFKIDVLGDGTVFNLDGAGLTALNGIRCVGELAANQYIFQVADGYIGKTATFTIANAVVGQLDIYGFSTSKGRQFVRHEMSRALANVPVTVSDFLYAAFPSAGANDIFNVTFAGGTMQPMHRTELAALLSYKQEVVSTRYNADNWERGIISIQFIGVAEQSIYFQRGGLVIGR